MFIDGEGRLLEVIVLDRCDGHGPCRCIRASRNGVLLGAGYFERLEDALALVDVGTLVELVALPAAPPAEAGSPAASRPDR